MLAKAAGAVAKKFNLPQDVAEVAKTFISDGMPLKDAVLAGYRIMDQDIPDFIEPVLARNAKFSIPKGMYLGRNDTQWMLGAGKNSKEYAKELKWEQQQFQKSLNKPSQMEWDKTNAQHFGEIKDSSAPPEVKALRRLFTNTPKRELPVYIDQFNYPELDDLSSPTAYRAYMSQLKTLMDLGLLD